MLMQAYKYNIDYADYGNNGGILTGLEIYRNVLNENIKITPFNVEQLNPNSYNLRLGDCIKEYDVDEDHPLDFKHKIPSNKIIKYKIPEEGLVLKPGKFYLGTTIENTFTDKFIPMIDGRSSGGRLGISVHICAGFGDIGFFGKWTLEITAEVPVRVYAGDQIAQISFYTPCGNINCKYKGRYQNQKNVMESLSSDDIKNPITEQCKDLKMSWLLSRAADEWGLFSDTKFDCSLQLYEGEVERAGFIYRNHKRIGRIYTRKINNTKEKLYVRAYENEECQLYRKIRNG